MISLGIEQVSVSSQAEHLKGKKIGLLCNQASTDRKFRHSRELVNKAFPGLLTCILSPQHGFFSEKQDNMVESGHAVDKLTGVPIFSLYGETRRPHPSMYDHLDVLLVDLFDVGTRVYTFIYTLAYCLEAAASMHKKVILLDRPNPLGGITTEGNLLQDDCRSFVGLYPIPMRHGLTIAEMALLMNSEFGINADLSVIPMQGWKRDMLFHETGLPWVFPSPNMPTPETAMVFPGQVIWEGTNISEGRGTTLPFELFGAPFLNHEAILDIMQKVPLPGCVLRPLVFEPTFHKWSGEACNGFQIHVTDPTLFKPYRTSLALLQAIMSLYPEEFQYKQPPYEYEYKKLPLDLILGDISVRKALEEGVAVPELEKSWRPDLEAFETLRRKYFLYD